MSLLLFSSISYAGTIAGDETSDVETKNLTVHEKVTLDQPLVLNQDGFVAGTGHKELIGTGNFVLGNNAFTGDNVEGDGNIVIGESAGENGVVYNSIMIGAHAGDNAQADNAIMIGNYAGFVAEGSTNSNQDNRIFIDSFADASYIPGGDPTNSAIYVDDGVVYLGRGEFDSPVPNILRGNWIIGNLDLTKVVKFTDNWSVIIGKNNTSESENSFVSGQSNATKYVATSGLYRGIPFYGPYSHAEGLKTSAAMPYSHSEGINTKVVGVTLLSSETVMGGHAEGSNTTVYASAAHAEGNGTTANADNSHSEGVGTLTEAEGSHAEGYHTTTHNSKQQGVQRNAKYSHAEGKNTSTWSEASHSEGVSTSADGDGSHSEGSNTTASGSYSHSEGIDNRVMTSGSGSHVEGEKNTVSGISSHAEGYSNTVAGAYSHAEGFHNTIRGSGHAEGIDNTIDTLASYAHVDGRKVTANHPYSYTWNGKDEPYESKGEGYFSISPIGDINGFFIGPYSFYQWMDGYVQAIITGYMPLDMEYWTFGSRFPESICGSKSFVNGFTNIASASYAHAEGKGSRAAGQYSHAEGLSTQTSALYAHAEGEETIASGTSSHSEGIKTSAENQGAHAEGNETRAAGKGSHAEGNRTIASNMYSHAEGTYSVASNDYAFVWSGVGNNNNRYGSHGDSTFNVNPDKGAEGFFIGETNLVTLIGAYSKAPENCVLYNENGGIEVIRGESQSAADGALSQGIDTKADGDYSTALGVNTETFGEGSIVAGVDVFSTADHSFTWSGVDTDGEERYTGNNTEGSFNVNPVGGFDGFYVGESNLTQQIFGRLYSIMTNNESYNSSAINGNTAIRNINTLWNVIDEYCATNDADRATRHSKRSTPKGGTIKVYPDPVAQYTGYVFNNARIINSGSDAPFGNMTFNGRCTSSTNQAPPNSDPSKCLEFRQLSGEKTASISVSAAEYDPLAGATKFTVMAWIYRDDTSDTKLTASRIVSDESDTSGNSGFELRLNKDGNNAVLTLLINGTTVSGPSTSITPDSKQWYHVCACYDGTKQSDNVKFYVNGTWVGTYSTTAGLVIGANNTAVHIGRTSSGNSYQSQFIGYIDDVMLFKDWVPSSSSDVNHWRLLDDTTIEMPVVYDPVTWGEMDPSEYLYSADQVDLMINEGTALSLKKYDADHGVIYGEGLPGDNTSFLMGNKLVVVTNVSGEVLEKQIQSQAEGYASLVIGNGVIASGSNSVAIGQSYTEYNSTSGEWEDQLTQATGQSSLAIGRGCTASGDYSHAEGGFSRAYGTYSYAFGDNAIAYNFPGTIVIGRHSKASNDYAVVLGGDNCLSAGTNSLTIGRYCAATNNAHYGVAIGDHATVSQENGVAMGKYTDTIHSYAFAWSGNASSNAHYQSKANGSFCIDPVGGASGFYIGNTTLQTLINSSSSLGAAKPQTEKWATLRCRSGKTKYTIPTNSFSENIIHLFIDEGTANNPKITFPRWVPENNVKILISYNCPNGSYFYLGSNRVNAIEPINYSINITLEWDVINEIWIFTADCGLEPILFNPSQNTIYTISDSEFTDYIPELEW